MNLDDQLMNKFLEEEATHLQVRRKITLLILETLLGENLFNQYVVKAEALESTETVNGRPRTFLGCFLKALIQDGLITKKETHAIEESVIIASNYMSDYLYLKNSDPDKSKQARSRMELELGFWDEYDLSQKGEHENIVRLIKHRSNRKRKERRIRDRGRKKTLEKRYGRFRETPLEM